MKQHALFFLLIAAFFALLPAMLAGQTPCGIQYARILAEGDDLFKRGHFKDAFEKYRAARGCTEAEHAILDQKVEDVLRAVDSEREKADRSATIARKQQQKAEAAQRKANEALIQAKKEEARAVAAEKKATAVLDKIYFYQDRFGLAHDNVEGKYGFIDKNLQTKIAFRYIEAMPFDYTGFAWVKKQGDRKQLDFLIDTLGNEYPLAYDIAELKENTKALDLRNRDIDSLPVAVCRHTQLKLLLLGGNQLVRLPPEIGNLKDLIFLGLSRNQLDQLPPELGNLQNLISLQVFNNRLTQLPPELGNLKNLVSLILYDNHLTGLPPQVGTLKNLQLLDLGRNQITILPPQMMGLKKLQKLWLKNNLMPENQVENFRTAMPWCKIEF